MVCNLVWGLESCIEDGAVRCIHYAIVIKSLGEACVLIPALELSFVFIEGCRH